MSSLLVICLECSESGQKQSVKLLQNMVYSTIQHPLPSHIHCLYILYILVWKGGVGQREVQ
jgi:hypothetical protein